MNKRGMLGQIIGIVVIIGFVLFFEIIDITNNITLLPLIFLAGILFVLVPMTWRIFKGIFYGIKEFFEDLKSFETKSYDKHNKKKKSLKERKTKYNKELIRKSSNVDNVGIKPKEDEGVQWGSGVDSGEGMKTYEN